MTQARKIVMLNRGLKRKAKVKIKKRIKRIKRIKIEKENIIAQVMKVKIKNC